MPEGMLDFFELVWAESQSLDSRESKKDILYTGTLYMYLDERDNRTDQMQALRIVSHGTLQVSRHIILFESESAPEGVKTPDGTIDGIRMDVKAVEGYGKWSIKDKFYDSIKKNVECVILYFHRKELYSVERLDDGWVKFINDKDSQRYRMTIKRVLCVVEQQVFEWRVPK